MMNWKKRSGLLLILTSIIHNLIGIVLFWEPLVDIFQAGVFNSVAPHFDRATLFWFLLSGALMFILGHFMHWLVNDLKIEIPAFLGWHLLWLSIVGAFIIPASGFWLVLPQALIILKRS
jgi:hypothetical protein